MDTTRREPMGLRRLSDLSDYDVADGRPDVRRWTIQDVEGRALGKVDDLVVDTGTMTVRYLELELDRKALELHTDHDKHVIVPVEQAHLDRDHKAIYVSGLTRAAAEALPEFTGGEHTSYPSAWERSDTRNPARHDRLTRAEEELRIDKRRLEGEVRATKHVDTEHVRKEVPVRREEVVTERRPVASHEMRGARIGEDEVRMPIVEEEVIVEKRPVVKEEVIIGKKVHEDTEIIDTDVRRERIDVEKTGEAGRRDPAGRNRVK
jgi:uncharacterized protein (TIGR02271 family)